MIKTSVYYLLNARNPTPEKQADHLRRIERNVEVADNVITALSNFAKIPMPDLRPIAIEPMMREVAGDRPAGRRDRGHGRLPRRLPMRLGDGDQLRIALGNLIRNARDAMPNGGRLTVASRAVDGGLGGLGRRYRDRDRGEGPGSDHGTALLDEGSGAGPGACHRPVDRGEEPRKPAAWTASRERERLHGPPAGRPRRGAAP